MFVTHKFATLLKTATGRVLSSVYPFISSWDVVLLDFAFESQRCRDIVTRSLRPRRLLHFPPRPISRHVETRPSFFPPSSSANRSAPTRESKSRVICPNFSLSFSLLRPFASLANKWISLEFLPSLSFEFPAQSFVQSIVYCVPFLYFVLLYYISENQIYYISFFLLFYSREGCLAGGQGRGKWTARFGKASNQFQRNTLRTLVVFMTDGRNGELIPWQSGGRLYNNGIIGVDK